MSDKRYEIEEYDFYWDSKRKRVRKIPWQDKRERLITKEVNGKTIYTDPMLEIEEYTKKFISERKGAKKQDGMVKMHPAFKGNQGQKEKATASWLAKDFGWDVMVDKENTRGRNTSYIDLFNGRKWWEEKSPSSITAVGSRLKKGLHQLANMQPKTRGGIILNVTNDNTDKLNGFTNEQIKEEVVNTINEQCRVNCYVVIRRSEKVIGVYKVKHKKSVKPKQSLGNAS